ncbi:chromatin associated protein KTI12 [Hysterangium stoloniferum]|nr:chromatin associated protein KTI12 [Hysterangium stoloniferum]
MALVTITGYPCSGKSRRAQQLKSYLESRFQSHVDSAGSNSSPTFKVVLVSDDLLNLPTSVYNDSRLEKPARSALFTAVQRHMNPSTVVILDSANYIKGFRYQLYCAAKEAGVRVCTMFVVATPEQCMKWNAERAADNAYAPETLNNMIMRYEEPSSMVRWDSPLFTLPWDEEKIPEEELYQAITMGEVKPANAGTRVAHRAPVDALQTLESTTSTIVSSIMSEQTSSGIAGGLTNIILPSATQLHVQLPDRSITLSELQRFKRSFVGTHKRAITQGVTEKGSVDFTEQSIGSKFVEYLEQNLRP